VYAKVLYIRVDNISMTTPTALNTATQISDALLQQIRNFLDDHADMVAVGSDPAQPFEPNAAMRLLTALDVATDGEFQ
jgi:hypothetical protein